ncbi:hypothetical protein [Roseinatronobacter monicus]|uniref:PhyR sigma2 domain-containing protein n=1 Tax=Roseinatronobacter monicus TaxID=393481 RepID=A0A543KG04_9RHOB|nr:hypothetical protein BD293_2664 [Roseinatronobacter monicus]
MISLDTQDGGRAAFRNQTPAIALGSMKRKKFVRTKSQNILIVTERWYYCMHTPLGENMSTSLQIAKELPYLRRYARALTGSQSPI